MPTSRLRKPRNKVTSEGLSDAQIMSFIDGFNFWYGPDYGPEGAFLTEDHKRVMWQEVKKGLVALVQREARQNNLGYWDFRGSYLPFGPTIESFFSFWQYDKKEVMPRPEPQKLSKL